LLGLYLLAIRLGQYQGQLDMEAVDNLIGELIDLGDVILKANESCKEICKTAARDFKDSPAVIFLGSGPNFGTAVFSAAKICEACGVISFGQDLEEFAHVESLCYPNDMPIVVLSAKGKSHWRAIEIAKFAKTLGKRVMVAGEVGDEILDQGFDYSISLPVHGREEFSPLYYHVISDYLAGFLTEELGRKLFRSDQNRSSTAMSSNIQMKKRDE
jgi:glucosamine--fructose-6-phosphate aminotransferase (isomerizing)